MLRLRHGTTSPELEVLEEATAAAGDLTRQLQSFARLRRATPQRLSLSGAVQDARALLRTLAGGVVRLEVERCEPGHVLIDPSDLNRVLVNLVTNAADALDRDGKISLSVRRRDLDQDLTNPAGLADGAYLAFVVSDTGCGMSPEVQARLFEPFFTTKAPGPHCHGGTGLGLATCHGIAGQAGGGISVESELGVGTTITVFLPLAREPELPAPAPAPQVLLVEDEALLRQVMTQTLERSRYRVLSCASAEEALTADADFDLVLTDLSLPGQSGLDLAKALLVRRPDLPVICTSGMPQAADLLLEAGLQGRVAFLPKPHGARELVELVERLLSPRPKR